MKKIAGDIILHMCSKIHNHMWYNSWHIECTRQNVLSFWAIFCPFNLLTTRKIKHFEKTKRQSGDIIILHLCVTNDIILCKLPEKWSATIFCHFWSVFCTFTLLTTQKIKISKKWKKHLAISPAWTNGQTSEWIEKVTYRGGCPTL